MVVAYRRNKTRRSELRAIVCAASFGSVVLLAGRHGNSVGRVNIGEIGVRSVVVVRGQSEGRLTVKDDSVGGPVLGFRRHPLGGWDRGSNRAKRATSFGTLPPSGSARIHRGLRHPGTPFRQHSVHNIEMELRRLFPNEPKKVNTANLKRPADNIHIHPRD